MNFSLFLPCEAFVHFFLNFCSCDFVLGEKKKRESRLRMRIRSCAGDRERMRETLVRKYEGKRAVKDNQRRRRGRGHGNRTSGVII